VKLAQKRGKDTTKLREVILLLIEGSPLPERIRICSEKAGISNPHSAPLNH
jgi:mRNA-degrading endonuclease YafQ of YafQ-DinJ toxin-antitoxin module